MDEQLQILNRVEELSKKPGNNVCAECPERHPTWVSLIRPALRGGEVMGVFVCDGCSKHHFQLGRKINEVKGMTMATKWSFKELGCVSKSGNEMVNSIYEGNQDEWADDKEIITFDKEEAARLRGDYIRNKYSERKYFSEDKFHATMNKLNPSYKRYDEVPTRASSPRRASMMAGTITTSVPSTPLSSKGRRASMNSPTRSPTQAPKENATTAASVTPPETPTKKANDLGTMLRNIKESADASSSSSSQTPRRAIPSSASLTTPRNGRRRSVMTSSTNSVTNAAAAADPYSKQRNSILAAVSPAELIKLGMSEDGSQRGGNNGGDDEELSSCSERSSMSARRSRRQSTLSRSLSKEDDLSGSRRGENSSRRQRHSILNREQSDRSLSVSRRGENSSRRQRQSILNREQSDRSLSGSQRGSRRESLQGSDRSHSARVVSRGDRDRRRQSLLRPENGLESESESETDGDFLDQNLNRNSNSLLPSSLQVSDAGAAQQQQQQQQQLASVNSSLKKAGHSMRTSRSSVSLSDGPRQQHSMRSGRTSVVLQEPDMVEHKKNLDKRRTSMLLANERLSRRSVVEKEDYSPPSQLHESNSSTSLRSSERSRRSERSSRSSKNGRSKSPTTKEKDSSPSRRGKRTSSGMKDRSDGSTRSRHMADTSDRMNDRSDPDNNKSTRGKRTATNGFSARSSRSKREGRTTGSRKSSSPSRRITKSVTISTVEDAKKFRNSRSVGTLGELVASGTSGSGSGAQNFDWKAHKKNLAAQGRGDSNNDLLRSSSHHERKGDPLSKGSGHDKKGSSKKPSKVKRHNSDGKIDDNDSDGSDGRSKRGTRSEKKTERRSMKKIPSSKAMSRSSSVGILSAQSDSKDVSQRGSGSRKGKLSNRRKSQSARNLTGIDLGDLGGGGGDEPRKSRSSKSSRKKSSSERRDSSANNADKYKNLDNGVANSSYSGGSLGMLMSKTEKDEDKATKEKGSSSLSNLSAAGTLGFLAQSSSSMTPKMSDVFGIKSAELKKAGRQSIVTQWLDPSNVAAAAKATIANKKEKVASEKKKSAPDIKHHSYNDAIVAQWLTSQS